MSIGCVFVACHSFVKLKDRRIELRELYKMFRFMDVIRPDYREVVGRYDRGDWFFLIAGISVPILVFDIVYNIISHDILVSIKALPFWVQRWGFAWVGTVSVLFALFALWAAWRSAKCVERERLEVLHLRKPRERPSP